MTVIDRTLARFLSYAKPYRWWIIGASICGILKFNVPLIFPLVLKHIIDYLTSHSTPTMADITPPMAALLVLYLFWSVVTYFRSTLADATSHRMIFDLRYDFFLHLQRLSLAFYHRQKVGALASRVLGDIATAQHFVGAAFVNTIMDLSTLVFIVAIMAYQNFEMALASLGVFPLYIVVNQILQNKIRITSKLAQDKMEEISGRLHEQLGAVSVVQSYVREKSEERRFFQDSRDHLSFLLRNVQVNALAMAFVGLLTAIAPIVVIWYGASKVVSGELTAGGLVAFYAYLGMLYAPLNRLSELNIRLANSRSAMERIFEVFDTAPEVRDRPGARDVDEPLRGNIEFRDVEFRYASGHEAGLHGINLRIPAGTTLALVGPSGAGKSTLAKLVPRMYDVSEGAVLIDGTDTRDLSLRSLRSNIALVLQETVLFSETILENIRYGRRNATRDEIIAAAHAAQAHDFIIALADGYDTVIGERGVTLSGGQQQRLSLARAFLKNAPILILDEATSSLDSESERAIQRAVIDLTKNRTTLIIAHRLTTIRAAHRIAVFDAGRIVQIGTHNELLAHDGLYRRLYSSQHQPQEYAA